MFINKIVLIFLIISSIAFSQTKKSADTIFVYEKVFVYKTVSKKGIKNIQNSNFDSLTRKKLSEVKQFRIEITADTIPIKMLAQSVKKDKNKKKSPSFLIDNYGVAIQSLFSRQTKIKSDGGGIGLFASKNIYNHKLFLNIEFLFSKVFSFTNKKAFKGYYITPNSVFYFAPENFNTQQINVPVTLSWTYRKFKPQLGIAYTHKQTEIDFFSYPNNTTETTVQKTSYKLTNSYFDFIFGVEYALSKRIGLSIKSKQMIQKMQNKNLSESLKPLEKMHFFPNQIAVGISYNLKKQ